MDRVFISLSVAALQVGPCMCCMAIGRLLATDGRIEWTLVLSAVALLCLNTAVLASPAFYRGKVFVEGKRLLDNARALHETMEVRAKAWDTAGMALIFYAQGKWDDGQWARKALQDIAKAYGVDELGRDKAQAGHVPPPNEA